MVKENMFVLYMSIFSIVVLSRATPTTAQTAVSDTITTTTWTKALSPYRVTGMTIVPSNNTLTIEPGVDVLFDADVQFIVQGRLYAVGTQADSIRFFKGTASNWRGIRISGGDTSTIAYMRISDGNARGITEQDSSGGALYLSGNATRVDMSNAEILGNTAQHRAGGGGGGGIYNCDNAALTMTNCKISGNLALGGYGGGIYNCDNAILTMTNCTISNNSAINGGGILNGLRNGARASMTMTSCTISDNKALYFGGGVANYSDNSTLTMTKCAISGNSARLASGGGVLNDFRAKLTMTNCTISGNSANSGGFVYNANFARLTVTNSILWENSASSEPEIHRQSGEITVRYSDVQDSIPSGVTDEGGNINADPLFVNAANGDYHLRAGSPCINAGDPDSPLDPDGTRADMGAFPYTHPPTSVLEGQQPQVFALHQNFPNPFNPETEILFQLPIATQIVLKIYNIRGEEIRTLAEGLYQMGEHKIGWNGRDENGRLVSTGIYLYQLKAPSITKVKKMTLIR